MESFWNASVTYNKQHDNHSLRFSIQSDTSFPFALMFGENAIYTGVTKIGVTKVNLHRIRAQFPVDIPFRIVDSERSVEVSLEDGKFEFFIPEIHAATDSVSSFMKKIDQGYVISKKGEFVNPVVTHERKEKYLKAYGKLKDLLEAHFPVTIAITHGTLLGLIRDGDFIPGDDDFDAFFYLGRLESAKMISPQRFQIASFLEENGFRVKIGVTGHIKASRFGVEVDLMPAWRDNEYLHISSYTSMPLSESDVTFCSDMFLDHPVKFLSSYKEFLAFQYGVDWGVPNANWRKSKSKNERLNERLLVPSEEEARAIGTVSLKRKLNLVD